MCFAIASAAPLRMLSAVDIDPAHAGFGLERHELRPRHVGNRAPPQPMLLGQDDDAAALRGLIGQRGQLSRVGHLPDRHPFGRDELGRLAVAERDRAGLVEQQDIHVPSRFGRAAAHGEHVLLHQPVDSGDADRAQQAADGRRDQAHQQCHQHRDREVHPGVDAEELQGHHHHQEDDRQGRQQDRQRDLVGRLLALGPLHEPDHVVQETFAGLAVTRMTR